MRVEKERQPRTEIINLQTYIDRRLNVTDAIGKRERDLLRSGRAGFANVIAGDRDRVPIRNFGGAVGKRVGYQSKARLGRIDVSSPGDVFLQDVVLDRAIHLVESDALFFRDREIETQKCGRRR